MPESVGAINAAVTQQVNTAAARNVQTLGGVAEKSTQTIQEERPEDRYQEGEDGSSLEGNKQLKQMALQYGGGAQSSAQAEEKGRDQKAEERSADGDGNARYQMDQLRRMANLNAQWSGQTEQPAAPQPKTSTQQTSNTGPQPTRTAPISPRPSDPQTTHTVAQTWMQNRHVMAEFVRRVPKHGKAAVNVFPRLPSQQAAERFGTLLGYFRSDQSQNQYVAPHLKPYAGQVGSELQKTLDLGNANYDAAVAKAKDPSEVAPPLYYAAKAIAAQRPDEAALAAAHHTPGTVDPALWLAARQFAEAHEADQAAATAGVARPKGPGAHFTGADAAQQYGRLADEARSSYRQAAASGGRFARVAPDTARQRFQAATSYVLTDHNNDVGLPVDQQRVMGHYRNVVQQYQADAEAAMRQKGEDPSNQDRLLDFVAQRALQDVNPQTGHANCPGLYALARQHLEAQQPPGQVAAPSIPPQQSMHPYSRVLTHMALASFMMPWMGMMAFNPFLMGAFM